MKVKFSPKFASLIVDMCLIRCSFLKKVVFFGLFFHILINVWINNKSQLKQKQNKTIAIYLVY